MKYVFLVLFLIAVIGIHLIQKHSYAETFVNTCDCEMLTEQNRDWSSRVGGYATQLNNCKQQLVQKDAECTNKLMALQKTYNQNISDLVNSKNQIEANYKQQILTMTDSYNGLIDNLNKASASKKENDQKSNQVNDASKALTG